MLSWFANQRKTFFIFPPLISNLNILIITKKIRNLFTKTWLSGTSVTESWVWSLDFYFWTKRFSSTICKTSQSVNTKILRDFREGCSFFESLEIRLPLSKFWLLDLLNSSCLWTLLCVWSVVSSLFWYLQSDSLSSYLWISRLERSTLYYIFDICLKVKVVAASFFFHNKSRQIIQLWSELFCPWGANYSQWVLYFANIQVSTHDRLKTD